MKEYIVRGIAEIEFQKIVKADSEDDAIDFCIESIEELEYNGNVDFLNLKISILNTSE